jgi:Mitochondrial carrier protein
MLLPLLQIRSIVAREGVRGLYAGYGAFLLRDLPFDAIEFVAYEQLRAAAGRMLGRDPNPAEVSLVGAAAGGFTGAINLVGAAAAGCFTSPPSLSAPTRTHTTSTQATTNTAAPLLPPQAS